MKALGWVDACEEYPHLANSCWCIRHVDRDGCSTLILFPSKCASTSVDVSPERGSLSVYHSCCVSVCWTGLGLSYAFEDQSYFIDTADGNSK